MSRYNPKTVLRQTSNSLLKEFFESRSVELDVAWEELRETKIKPVFDVMQRLPEEVRRPIEVILQEVHQVVSSDGQDYFLALRQNLWVDFGEKAEIGPCFALLSFHKRRFFKALEAKKHDACYTSTPCFYLLNDLLVTIVSHFSVPQGPT